METISWEVLKRHINESSPSLLDMGGTRNVRIGYNPSKQILFMRLPISEKTTLPPSSYSELATSIVSDDSGIVFEVSTNSKQLFPEFHRFAEIVAEIFEAPNQSAFNAFSMAIDQWQDLTAQKKILSYEQQLGLFGELLFLRALIIHNGNKSISAWTGRCLDIPDRHDFRVNDIDLEVKTTKNSQSIHIISSLSQLQPSIGHSLFVYSIKLENAGFGQGISLAELVNSIREILGSDIIHKKEFEQKIKSAGYRDNDSEYYFEKLILLDEPLLITINNDCPRITKEILSRYFPSESLGRLSDVKYRVNFEGLGYPQNSDFFKEVLGEITICPHQ